MHLIYWHEARVIHYFLRITHFTVLLLLAKFYSTNFSSAAKNGIEVVYDSPNSRCHADGRAFQCLPPFTNVAENVIPSVSSHCGENGKEEILCPATIQHSSTSSSNTSTSNCFICNEHHPKSQYSSKYLTDKYLTGNETCWMAAPQFKHSHEAVNITLSLGKRFEIYYVSLIPCGDMPHSIVVLKSSDFGASWKPWQYFSQDCEGVFRLPTLEQKNAGQTFGTDNAICLGLKPLTFRGSKAIYSESIIAFSTTFGRPTMQPWSPAIIEWMTITDVRIMILPYPQNSPSKSSLISPYVSFEDPLTLSDSGQDKSTSADTKIYYGFSDIAIGGRCKCNGHASRCIRENGRLRCDCQHNTAGDDCERCADSHLDQPWGRGTIITAHECKRCDCNLHTDKCKFSHELYLMSGQTSGGVCEDCQHNTAGRKCHYCADGFYRDWTLPLSHDHVCIQCRCHPIGATNTRLCDKKTGQCHCKEGVTGQFCDRCQDGYKQTRSQKQPCAPDFGMNRLAIVQERNCKPCRGMKKRFKFKKFCRKHLVIQATVLTSQSFGEFVRYEMQVHFVWRRSNAAWYIIPVQAAGGQSVQPLWMKMEDVVCNCPDLQSGATYLMVTDVKMHNNKGYNELLLSHKSLALPWQDAWQRRLLKFKKQEMRGECQKFGEKSRFADDGDEEEVAVDESVYKPPGTVSHRNNKMRGNVQRNGINKQSIDPERYSHPQGGRPFNPSK